MPTARPAISIRGVSKSIGALPVLQDVDLDVLKGETVSIIGPSGSGKSTLIRAMNALTPVDAGSIVVGGIDLTAAAFDKRALRKKVGIVFQSYNLFPHRTVLDNVSMAPRHVLGRKRSDAEAAAVALLKAVRLDGLARRYPGELSGGQQQRVAIARSLAMQPEIMLFDEVTAALDPETIREVLVVIRDLAADGMTCVLVTHEMGFAREISTTVVMLEGGRIVEKGHPSKMFTDPSSDRTRRFLARSLA